ncbi:MAG TPA: DUF4147 domain-containing protein, partial [Thermoanaerobaculia bacterium]|nr:DUF4147 domain-containing protein [Thermoanaerobaculia bacterium]
WAGRGVAIVPAGYETRDSIHGIDVILGSHPYIDDASFDAGSALLRFADSLDAPALVLLSGGASAAAEAPLEPHVSRGEVAALNERLVRSGLPIATINVARKHLSAIKGGRLALRLAPGSESWILSDVPPGRPELVGSGPTAADPSTSVDAATVIASIGGDEAFRIADALRAGSIPETPKRIDHHAIDVLADNRTLVAAAAEIAAARHEAVTIDEPLDGDVESVAQRLASLIENLGAGALAVAGGEPTVEVVGGGRGGRCSELALRLLRIAQARALPWFSALIGSSDGRDGNSGTAGYVIEWGGSPLASLAEIGAALASSDAHAVASRVGFPIQLPPTGNNLRDIMMMARR